MGVPPACKGDGYGWMLWFFFLTIMVLIVRFNRVEAKLDAICEVVSCAEVE